MIKIVEPQNFLVSHQSDRVIPPVRALLKLSSAVDQSGCARCVPSSQRAVESREAMPFICAGARIFK